MAEETENVKIIYVVPTTPTNLKNVYASKHVYVLSAIQLFCAILTLVLGIVVDRGIITELVAAIFFTVSGVFALAGARTGNRCLVTIGIQQTILERLTCLIITTMVFSILSAFYGFITVFWNAIFIDMETRTCAELSEKYGDVKMDTPYFVNVNGTRKSGSKYDASDEALCDPTKPETGRSQWGKINGTHIPSDHPCFTETCSNHFIALHSLLLVTAIIALVAAIATSAFTCRVTCCYTPPKGATAKVVFNKEEEEEEAEVGKYRELSTQRTW